MKERVARLIPLGSVVLLKGATKRVMVVGFLPTLEEDPSKVFDYMGCLYPEGIMSSKQNLVFNHDQIEKLICLGFSDEEEKKFKAVLNNTDFNSMIDDINN